MLLERFVMQTTIPVDNTSNLTAAKFNGLLINTQRPNVSTETCLYVNYFVKFLKLSLTPSVEFYQN